MGAETVEQLCQKARQAIAERDWGKAKQVYLQALGLRSDLPDIHYGLATVYFQLKELTSAAHHFKEVTRIDPLRVGALINLGAVQNLLDQPDDALVTLRRAIQRLHEAGVPTMTAVAYGERGSNPATQHSFIVTEELAPTVSLEDFSIDWVKQPPAPRLKRAAVSRRA